MTVPTTTWILATCLFAAAICVVILALTDNL